MPIRQDKCSRVFRRVLDLSPGNIIGVAVHESIVNLAEVVVFLQLRAQVCAPVAYPEGLERRPGADSSRAFHTALLLHHMLGARHTVENGGLHWNIQIRSNRDYRFARLP